MRPEIEKKPAKFTIQFFDRFKNRVVPSIILVWDVLRCWMVRRGPARYNNTPRGRASTHRLGQSKCKQL